MVPFHTHTLRPVGPGYVPPASLQHASSEKTPHKHWPYSFRWEGYGNAGAAIASMSDADNAPMRPEVGALILDLSGDIAASAVTGGSATQLSQAIGACDGRAGDD